MSTGGIAGFSYALADEPLQEPINAEDIEVQDRGDTDDDEDVNDVIDDDALDNVDEGVEETNTTENVVREDSVAEPNEPIEAEAEGVIVLENSSGKSSLIGKGSAEDPLRIYTAEQLKDFAECFNAGTLPGSLKPDDGIHLALMNDIDLGAYSNWEPIGTYNGTSNKPFKGSFKSYDTSTFTISGLNIEATVDNATANQAYGLFGYAENASFERVDVKASRVSVVGTAEVDLYVGVLAGYLQSGGSITACSTSGDVGVSGKSGILAGSLVGFSTASISGSSATGNIIADSSGSSAMCNVGGLIGFTSSSVQSSYATGSVIVRGGTAGNIAGGLVGYTSSSIQNTYATGSVTAKAGKANFAGGLVGNGSSVQNSVALNQKVSATRGSTNTAGRVVGINNGSLTNNYAWKDMVVTNGSDSGTITDSNPDLGADKRHGAQLLSSTALNASWWTSATGAPGFSTDIWKTQDGFLPLLHNPQGNAWRPLWLVNFPDETVMLTLVPQDLTFLQKDNETTPVHINANGTYINASPNTVAWEVSDESMLTLDSTSNISAGLTVKLDRVDTYSVSAALLGWSNSVNATMNIYVNGDLGEIGKATVTGDPVYQSTLNASFVKEDADSQEPRNPSYQWYVDRTPISGATEASLVLDNEEWIGKIIQVHIKAINYNDAAVSKELVVEKLEYTGDVLEPVLASKTTSSITVEEVSGYEYQIIYAGSNPQSLSDDAWQNSPTFINLEADRAYDIYQRVKATDTTKASTPQALLNISTDAAPLELSWLNNTNSYTLKSSTSFGVRVNYSFDLFKEVEIDNQVITQYQAESGSTVINLENAYLDSLSEGSHTIKVIFHDSKSAEGSFEVKASKPDPDPVDPVDPVDPADPKDPNKPTDIDTGTPIAKTSDNTGQLLVLVIATLLGAGVVLLAWRKLRQCSKK